MTTSHRRAVAPGPGRSRSAVPLFVAAEALSVVGNAAVGVVLPLLVLDRTGDAATAAVVAAFAAGAAVLSSFFGGWLADHVDRRAMSVLADLGSALAVAGLALVDNATGLTTGWFVALGIAGALFDVPGLTARETLMAGVGRAGGVSLDRIASVRQAVAGAAFLTGPALAGFLLTRIDPIQVVWLTAACSALAALCTLGLRITPEPGGVAAQAGFALLARDPGLRAFVVLAFGTTLVVAPLASVLVPAHFQALDQPEWLGYAMSGMAVGSMAGSALYALLSVRSRRRAFLTGLLCLTAGLLGACTLSGIWPVVAGSALIGLGNGTMGPIALIYVSESVPERVRGRALGVLNALTLVAGPAGLAAAGGLLTVLTPAGAATVLAAVWIAVALYAVTGKGLRSVLDPRK